ncbi:MAG: tetratricopeptide repeat protein [Gammaproteobacteria bacterium]
MPETLRSTTCRRLLTSSDKKVLVATLGLALGVLSLPGRTQDSDTGADSEDADSLFELGALQTELSEYDDAADTYLRGVENLIDSEGEFSPLLIDPYVNLADVYRRDGQYPEAITVLEHAQHISQRNFGLFNSDQVSIIHEMGRVYETAGDTRSAQEVQQRLLELGLRQHGDDSLEIVPFHYELAEYYEASRMRTKAREHYETVVEIREIHYGELAPELLEPLRALLRYDILSSDIGFARRRIEEILESGAMIPALERALSMVVVGDWELTVRREESALALYTEAYAVLAASDPASADALFASPVAINFIPPPSPVDLSGPVDNFAWGGVTAQFEVTANGRARYVEIVEALPANLMEARYRRRLRETYFRPRLADGVPAVTASVRFTHDFRYFVPE